MSAPSGLAAPRAAVYRVLASALLPPTEERVATLVAAAPEIVARIRPLRPMAFYPQTEALLRRLASLSEDEIERLRETYATLFLSGARGAPAPYGSAYLSPQPAPMVAAAVDAAYRAAGFVVDADGEAPDHVAIELDFLAALCLREAEAEEAGREAEAAELRRREGAFLREHLLPWLPAFEAAIARAAPGSLLAETVAVARRFAEHDVALLEALRADAG
ncbi:MAG: hypothetical protein KatS3mg014_1691 [Actinomycetota bacterium]|nr:MAG: hypothetical protein KatS3mg014_1691 [Actinomycetota bacterium]